MPFKFAINKKGFVQSERRAFSTRMTTNDIGIRVLDSTLYYLLI